MKGDRQSPTPSPSPSPSPVMGKEISKFLSIDSDHFLKILTEGFCGQCRSLLQRRFRVLFPPNPNSSRRRQHYPHDHHDGTSDNFYLDDYPPESHRHRHRQSYENDSYSRRRVYATHSSSENKKKRRLTEYSDSDLILDDGIAGFSPYFESEISEERQENIRLSKVRKQEFFHVERINGRATNVLQGLELHTGVFNYEEQKNIVDLVYHLQRMGRRGHLRGRTYSEPRKWMRGKGRVTIQFGCCYNYAMDKKGNPPGIIKDEQVDPMPSLFKKMIKRMVRWHILPPTCVPDSCIVNIYDEGDCIPPHIDHHDFLRPFCTASFLVECNILFGSRLEVLSPGEFSGPVSISLPKGSVLIFSGNGADIAKHCVPAVPAKRISITFRKMDERKLPYKFVPDPELQRIKPLDLSYLHREEENSPVRKRETNQSDCNDDYSPQASQERSKGYMDKFTGNELETEGDKKSTGDHNHTDDEVEIHDNSPSIFSRFRVKKPRSSH